MTDFYVMISLAFQAPFSANVRSNFVVELKLENCYCTSKWKTKIFIFLLFFNFPTTSSSTSISCLRQLLQFTNIAGVSYDNWGFTLYESTCLAKRWEVFKEGITCWCCWSFISLAIFHTLTETNSQTVKLWTSPRIQFSI